MRVLINLKPTENIPQPLPNEWMQGWVYNLLRGTDYDFLHEKERYKFFCFSNIFPFVKGKAFVKNSMLNLIISSPDKNFIFLLEKILQKVEKIILGKDYIFQIARVKKIYPRLYRGDILKSETPIVVSLTRELALKYNVPYNVKEGHPLFWNKEMSLAAFIDGLTKNSIRKCNEFYGKVFQEDLRLFNGFKFLEGAVVDYKGGKVAGSHWKLIPADDETALNVLQFCLDAGFGERNTAGFGFVNNHDPALN